MEIPPRFSLPRGDASTPSSAALPWSQKNYPAGIQPMCWAVLPASTTTVCLTHSSNQYLKLQLPLIHNFREIFLFLSSSCFDLQTLD